MITTIIFFIGFLILIIGLIIKNKDKIENTKKYIYNKDIDISKIVIIIVLILLFIITAIFVFKFQQSKSISASTLTTSEISELYNNEEGINLFKSDIVSKLPGFLMLTIVIMILAVFISMAVKSASLK